MPISFKKKIVYIHNQRTGGYSTTKALNIAGCEMETLGDKHMDVHRMKLIVPKWDEYFKFSFVRNPFDRLISIFFHRTQNIQTSRYLKYKNFHAFIKNYKNHLWELINQCDKFDDSMDFIGRFENFEQDYQKVCDLAKIKNCLPEIRMNKSVHKHYREYYTKKTRKIVEKIYKKDLETYGYGF